MSTRRRFLKAAGASLALPFLPSMFSAKARAAMTSEAHRLLIYTIANGFHIGLNANDPDPESLLPELDAVMGARRSIVTGTAQVGLWGPYNDHEFAMPGLLTDATVSNFGGPPYDCGISCDQVAAKQIGNDSPFPSIQIAPATPFEPISTSGYVYSTRMSWASPTTPMSAVESPRQLFDQMFAGVDTTATQAEIDRRSRLRTSLLDTLLDDVSSLETKLNSVDRVKLDQYTTGVRELEQRIEQLEDNTCPVPEAPNGSLDLENMIGGFVDLAVIALQCDFTRVITLLSSPSSSYATYPFLPGVSGNHHGVSHYFGGSQFQQLMSIERWHVAMFAQLAQRLEEIQVDEDGTDLLSKTLLVLTSEFTDPNPHQTAPMPFVLVGGEAGGVAQGRHLALPAQTPHANLLRSFIAFTGADPGDFGPNHTGTVDLS